MNTQTNEMIERDYEGELIQLALSAYQTKVKNIYVSALQVGGVITFDVLYEIGGKLVSAEMLLTHPEVFNNFTQTGIEILHAYFSTMEPSTEARHFKLSFDVKKSKRSVQLENFDATNYQLHELRSKLLLQIMNEKQQLLDMQRKKRGARMKILSAVAVVILAIAIAIPVVSSLGAPKITEVRESVREIMMSEPAFSIRSEEAALNIFSTESQANVREYDTHGNLHVSNMGQDFYYVDKKLYQLNTIQSYDPNSGVSNSTFLSEVNESNHSYFDAEELMTAEIKQEMAESFFEANINSFLSEDGKMKIEKLTNGSIRYTNSGYDMEIKSEDEDPFTRKVKSYKLTYNKKSKTIEAELSFEQFGYDSDMTFSFEKYTGTIELPDVEVKEGFNFF